MFEELCAAARQAREGKRLELRALNYYHGRCLDDQSNGGSL